MLTPGGGAAMSAAITQTAQVADLVMTPEEVTELIKLLNQLREELDVESLPRASLESVAWGQEFEETGRLHQAYANAQRLQRETAEKLRADAAELVRKLEATRDDLVSVDDQNAHQVQAGAAENLEGAGRTDQTQAAQQQVRDELARNQQPASAGGESAPGQSAQATESASGAGSEQQQAQPQTTKGA